MLCLIIFGFPFSVSSSAVALLGLCLTGKGQFHLIVGNGDEALECFIKGFGLSVYLHGWSNVQVRTLFQLTVL